VLSNLKNVAELEFASPLASVRLGIFLCASSARLRGDLSEFGGDRSQSDRVSSCIIYLIYSPNWAYLIITAVYFPVSSLYTQLEIIQVGPVYPGYLLPVVV
jgi:hypothetical protein